MNKTLVLFLVFVIIASAGLGFSAAAAPNSDDIGNITVSSYNQNLQHGTHSKILDKDPGKKTLPLQKTGLPTVPALLSTLMISSGLLYERLRK